MIRLRSLILLAAVSGALLAPRVSGDDHAFPLNLLFSREDVPRILENTERPLFQEYWQSLLDADFEEDGNFLREAFIYALTENPTRGARARAGMLATLERKRWDIFVEDGEKTLGFLTAGRLTAWMALSYDWIYDLLSPAERAEVLRQIAEQGCVPCYRALHGMRYPEEAGVWSFDPEHTDHYEVPDMSRWPVILGHNNFRAVISGGFALGLFALEGQDDRFAIWKEMLLDSYERSTRLYGADGSYDEGIAYANYANTYLVYLIEVMRRKRGIELFDGMNFVGMMDCNLALFYPHHLDPTGSVNFGDAGPSMYSSNLFWAARRSRDGLTQYQGIHYASRHDLFSLVYFDPTVEPVAPDDGLYFKKLPFDWIVTRTGYAIDDLVVAMRSGPPANHEHADRNSVILKYGGEILLTDSKRPTYNAKSPAWLLRTSAAHNTLFIDGQGHPYHDGSEGTNASEASARIVRQGERPNYVFWASDATPAHALVDPDVGSVTRTVVVFREVPFVLVLDKVIKTTTPSTVSARWFVENSDEEASLSTDASTFTMQRPHARFFAAYAGSTMIDVTEEKLPLDAEFGVFPYVEAKTETKAKETLLMLAGVPLMSEEPTPSVHFEQEGIGQWTVELRKEGKVLKVRILDHDRLPEFEVLENQPE